METEYTNKNKTRAANRFAKQINKVLSVVSNDQFGSVEFSSVECVVRRSGKMAWMCILHCFTNWTFNSKRNFGFERFQFIFSKNSLLILFILQFFACFFLSN